MTKTKKQAAAGSAGKKPKRIVFKEWIKGLSLDERLNFARQSIEGVNNVASFLSSLHETNQIVVYSDLLSSQVGTSYAANAYNTFTRGLQEIELVRLCSLWDKGERDAFSIPTVIGLIDNADLIARISREAGETRAALGEKYVRLERRRIFVRAQCAIREAKEIAGSEMLANVVNFRNKYIAHATGLTYAERDNGPLPLPKLGDETELLAKTLEIIGNLDLCVRGVAPMWKNNQETDKRNAEYLWHGVTIKVLR